MSDADITPAFLSRLRAFVRRRVRSDEVADDITQDVMLKFVRDRDSIKAGRGPAWMFTVARREIIDRHRRASPPMTELSGEEPMPLVEEEVSVLEELSYCVQPLLDRLSSADQGLLRRVDLQGESQAKIADAMGIPRSTIKAQVQRARERFHQELSACCAIALDVRGTPRSFAATEAAPCSCDSERPCRH